MRRGLDSHSTVIQLLPTDLLVGEIDRDAETSSVSSIGDALERYVLHAELARGTFGIIFAAHDTRLDREVAIKVLHPELATHPEIAGRFVREASSMARLNHPGIVTILDWGELGDSAYIVMDLLTGESLATHMARVGRLLLQDTIEIMKQVTEALHAAHDSGVLHRALKPENIFLVPDESMAGGVRVKLIDFGLAKEIGSQFRTGVVSLYGTPQFMSPEQCRCSSSVDHRTDIYSLGILLFELVAGYLPFDGSLDELIALHQYTPPPSAASAGRCPAQLDALIARMLAKDPADRPQSALEVRDELERLSLGRLGSAPRLAPMHDHVALPRPASESTSHDLALANVTGTQTPIPAGAGFRHATAWAPWRQLVPLALGCIAIGILSGALLAG